MCVLFNSVMNNRDKQIVACLLLVTWFYIIIKYLIVVEYIALRTDLDQLYLQRISPNLKNQSRKGTDKYNVTGNSRSKGDNSDFIMEHMTVPDVAKNIPMVYRASEILSTKGHNRLWNVHGTFANDSTKVVLDKIRTQIENVNETNVQREQDKHEIVQIVGGKYRIARQIGKGHFGVIYRGNDMFSGKKVAVKFEPVNSTHSHLNREKKIYHVMEGAVGFPRILYVGKEGNYNTMVMDLLGPSLEEHFAKNNRKFSLQTILLLAVQMINRIEYIHSKNFIYRDVKPHNFMTGLDPDDYTIYAIDFGLTQLYRHPESHRHIPYKTQRMFAGTIRYTSINTHRGIQQSRRDDMESLGYVLLYFLRGRLPWQGFNIEPERLKADKVLQSKLSISITELCRGFPSEFATYLRYSRSLKFEEQPNYTYLRTIFRNLYRINHYNSDHVLEWKVVNKSVRHGNTVQDVLSDA